ncbi:MAG TPA: hypothetical protein VF173_11230 [Thermoanaerobaculia bacterium]|nr:hypothetical protein [Thermoanaerobaculia bacterium]
MRNRTILMVLGVLLLLGLSPVFADPIIQRGIDVFTTVGDGRTFYDFSFNPIPADFFCKGSKAFTGRVAFRGLPLTTGSPGQLWGADTVIERLDDAVFGDNGIAETRIQFRALSLVSTAPVKTACGAFHVYVTLGGKQRVTTMSILRTQETGGTFIAPLAVDARMTFIPVKPPRNKGARKLELTGSFTFPASSLPWSLASGAALKRINPVMVDTDGDLIPDTLLPGTSNFAAGQSPDRFRTKAACSCCPESTCHTDPATGKTHCTTPTACPGMNSCC